ncbi:hypothetical protein SAMN06269185_2758 [Natronoarchaeum philippinense]|uniref:DUF4352 domain-containing protein n=1 Tax=Natronoarchaeum philippinense TaxID=558529 RepID=A0A285P3I3_NATPI|nr:hypothetical protein [Natronoarchaeum philippinense]SNZ16309.1 hypothetical protein SAMN06269185_2758 [Natronoarchaeum philippinense]
MTEQTSTHRRTVLATGATLAAAGIAGCTGVLGGDSADGEVTANEFGDDIEVLDHGIENAKLGGTNSVRVNVTVTNNTNGKTTVSASADLYDGDDVLIARTGPSGSISVRHDQDVELHPSAPGRVGEVARYELQLTDPWSS